MATRLYAIAASTPPISPTPDAGWLAQGDLTRRLMATTKDAVTETITTNITSGAGNNAIGYQWISDPLAAQTISGTWSLVIRGREIATTDNVNKRWRKAYVVASDGSTIRGTLEPLAATASTVELSTSLAGRVGATNAGVTSVVCQAGDRIVIEMGFGLSSTGTSPQAELACGGTGTDHANSEGDTTGTVPWVEFSANISFIPGPSSVTLTPCTVALTPVAVSASEPGGRVPPTRVSTTQESNWQAAGTAQTSAAVSWQAGDVIVAMVVSADQGTVYNTPTGTGLSFSPIGSPVDATNTCWGHKWQATPASSGSSVIQATVNGGGTAQGGIVVWVFRGSDGVGNAAATGGTGHTGGLTRSQDESAVVGLLADWSAGTATITWTPTSSFTSSTTKEVSSDGGASTYTVVGTHWPDENVAGTTSYGVSAGLGSGNITKLLVEVKGTASAGGPSTVTLTPCAVALTPTPLVATPGVTLSPASVALSPVAVQPAIGVTLTPCVVALTPVPLSAVPSVTLTPCTVTISPRQLTLSSAVILTPATMSLTPQALLATPGVTLTPATINIAPQALTLLPTLVLTPATINIAPVALNTGSGPSSVTLTPCLLSLSAIALSPVPQPVVRTLTPATVAVTPVPLTAAIGVTLTPCTVQLAPVAVALALVPVARTLTPATLAVSAVPVTPVPQPVSVTLTPCTVVLSAAQLGFQAAGFVGLTPAQLTITPTPLSLRPTIILTPAVFSLTPVSLGVTNPSLVTLTPCSVSLLPSPITPTPGPVSLMLSPATLALAARVLAVAPGAVSLTLTPVQLALVARQLTYAVGPVSLALTPQEIQLRAIALLVASYYRDVVIPGGGIVGRTGGSLAGRVRGSLVRRPSGGLR